MKAAFIEKTGSVDNIIYGDMPKPKATGSSAVVQVKAVSVNPIDTYIRSGTVAMDLPKPFILGCDLAGVVETVGPDVKRFKAGDRVWGTNQGLFGRQGTFAQYAAVDEQWLYNLPEEASFEEAAAVALVGITAHLGLFHQANLRVSEKLFVHGGSGGVGSCVVQMAHAIGAYVMTTAGSEEKLQICKKLGANVVVNYKSGDLDEALKEFSPVDVWFESLRDPNLERAVKNLAKGGRLIIMAGRDAKPVFPLGPFYTRDARMLGFAMFNAPPDQQRKSAAEINRWLARGRLKPQIDRVMKISQAAEAHKLQEQSTLGKKGGSLTGKIVLVP
jgi:NADPH2:quinone reductase